MNERIALSYLHHMADSLGPKGRGGDIMLDHPVVCVRANELYFPVLIPSTACLYYILKGWSKSIKITHFLYDVNSVGSIWKWAIKWCF
jgi:hypothetical protein